MPKSDLPIGGEYAPVADRIALFYLAIADFTLSEWPGDVTGWCLWV